jgi:hypothetical protein
MTRMLLPRDYPWSRTRYPHYTILKAALQEVESPDSVFWRYKYHRRLYRLKNSFLSNTVYRTNSGLAYSQDHRGRQVKEPTNRAIAGNPAFAIGDCFSRPWDKRNSQYVNNIHSFKPSPWTIPEIRAFYDFESYREQWLVDNQATNFGQRTGRKRPRE